MRSVSIFALIVFVLLMHCFFIPFKRPSLREGFKAAKHSIGFLSRFAAREQIFLTYSLYSTPLTQPMLKTSSQNVLSVQSGFTPATSPILSLVSKYNPREISIRSGKRITEGSSNQEQSLVQTYSKYCLDFSKDEQSAIRGVIASVPQLQEFDWRFVKLDDSLEFCRPWIFLDHIILPASCCTQIVKEYKSNQQSENVESQEDADNPFADSTGLLMRMLVYLQAGKQAQKYDKYCSENLGFVKVKNVVKPRALQQIAFTDPNCLDDRWVYPQDDTYVYLCLVINDQAQLEARAYDALLQNSVATILESWNPAANICAELGADDCHHPLVVLGGSPFVLFESTS